MDISHDADDLRPGPIFMAPSQLDSFAKGILVGPHLPRRHLADDGNRGRSRSVGFGEQTSALLRNPHRAKVVRANLIPVHTWNLRVWNPAVLNLEACSIETAAARCSACDS